jgi:hypothetical protein
MRFPRPFMCAIIAPCWIVVGSVVPMHSHETMASGKTRRSMYDSGFEI